MLCLLGAAGCDWFGGSPTVTPGPASTPARPLPGSPTSGDTPAASTATRQPTTPAAPAAPAAPVNRGDVNLAHLNFLVEDVTIAGQPMAITHIYSEAPKYEWVDASGEGISCVDDAARAAVVYLTDYAATHDPATLDKAQRLLNFVLYMQAEDGQFYNFITDRAGTINKTGNTSYKTSGWWAARGAWALATGIRVLRASDPATADKLRAAFIRIRDVWATEVAANYGKSSPVHGIPVPGWLIDGGGDVTSIAVLALLEYDRAANGADAPTRDLLTKLCEALAAYQPGDHLNYPWGMHPDSAAAPGYWHAWGSTQVFALARAGQQLAQPAWVASARRAADMFAAKLMAGPMVSEWGVLPLVYAQIAYGLNSLTQGYLALHQATGDESYGRLAGLAAAWFYGNNSARFAMYDPATGRGYDGLSGPSEFRVNRNAGAESTIEALMALQGVSADPVAAKYLHYQPESGTPWQVLEAENAKQTAGDPATSYRAGSSTGEGQWSNGHYVVAAAGDGFSQLFTLPAAGRYHLYAAAQHAATTQQAFQAEALHAGPPPAIDGDLADWSAAQPLSATTTANILRGAAGWGGPERDAFVGYLQWDEQNLYIAARVFDPEHGQAETGPSVWKGDVLWVYMDGNHDQSSVDIKLTLAQTPDGPQIWDWKANRFVPDGQLAWKQTDGGYIYEARLPWKALGVSKVAANTVMGLELGRGCCGSGFQDLSGTDPDVARNLVLLTLVDTLSPGAGNQTAGATGPDAVALRWAIDGTGARKHNLGGSPDRDYLWLDRLTSAPLDLTAGEHTLTFEYAGSDPNRGVAVDGFFLLPVPLTQTLTGPNGARLTISYNVDSGKLTLEDH
jgi:hypothetical protein